jgi:hypothetical protein
MTPDDRVLKDPDDISEIERTLLRDVARIRGTLPPVLDKVEDFILEWQVDAWQCPSDAAVRPRNSCLTPSTRFSVLQQIDEAV